MPTVREKVIRFHAPLRGLVQVDPALPLPPLPVTVARQPVQAEILPREAAPPPEAPPPTPPLPPPTPETFWETEIAQQLKSDREHLHQTLSALQQALQTLEQKRTQQMQDWERSAIELAVTLAARMLHDRITASDFPVETLVRDMIGEFSGTESMVIYLHPEDLALLNRRLEGQPLLEGREIRVLPDPELGRADCRVEAGDDVMVSDLDAQLTELRRQLMRSLRNAQT